MDGSGREGAGDEREGPEEQGGVTPASCVALAGELAELALGILEGRRRAELLAHTEHCARCGAELAAHAATLDELLEAVPEVEPPIGFGARLAQRMASEPPLRSRPALLRRRLMAAALVLVLLGGAAALAASLGATRHDGAAGGPIVASLDAAGQPRGDVLVSSGHPSFMTVVLVDRGFSGWVTCEVTTSQGKWLSVGGFEITGGQGAWTVPLDVAPADLAGARIVTDSGSTLATARFSR